MILDQVLPVDHTLSSHGILSNNTALAPYTRSATAMLLHRSLSLKDLENVAL